MQIFEYFSIFWLSGQSLACPKIGKNKYGVYIVIC